MTGFLKKISILIFLSCCLFTCQEPANNTPTNAPIKTTTPKSITPKDCEVQGKVLEKNRIHFANQNRWICIAATDSTKDKSLGDSHRMLQIYDAQNCQLLNSITLPVNQSPDFPYYIADIVFNKSNSIVAIKGRNSVFCYDVKNEKLLEQLEPGYLNERMTNDASSGSIQHLEVWENYLIGYAQDFGIFVFDLTNIDSPKSFLPAAEYDLSKGEGESFSSLFFLQSQNGQTHQAILPAYDFDNRKLNVNPLFESPQNVKATIPKNVSDNRFLVLKNEKGNAFAIDMENQKTLDLPENLRSGSVQDILSWLKK